PLAPPPPPPQNPPPPPPPPPPPRPPDAARPLIGKRRCTSNCTLPPPSVFCRVHRFPKRWSIAPPISVPPRSRCSIAAASTAHRASTKPRSAPVSGRSSARN